MEESERLTAAEGRAVKAESRAEVAELALRKKVERSQAATVMATAGPSTSTPPGTNQPGGGKRRRGTPEEQAERAKKKKGDRRPAASQGQDQGQDQGQGQSQGQDQGHDQGREAPNGGNEEWRKVKRKRKPKKKGPKPPSAPVTKPRRVWQRPEALVIGEAVGTSYADILRKVKEDPSLKDLGEKVVAVRRTQKGNLLIELKRVQGVHSVDYKAQVEKVVGEAAKVRALSQEVSIECRGVARAS